MGSESAQGVLDCRGGILGERCGEGGVAGCCGGRGVPTDEISIGKKPRDTTDGDTYAGDIDNITITRWEPVTS